MLEKFNKPNFFIISPERSGSTSLYFYLKDHPQIYLSPIKEPNFFSKDKFLKEREKGESKPLIRFLNKEEKNEWDRGYAVIINNWITYLKLFRFHTNEKVIGEASTSYFSSKVAADEIKNKIPNAKHIFLLRNPVDRIYSFYHHKLKDGYIKLDEKFDDLIHEDKEFLEEAKYYNHVKMFFENFPKNNFYFCLFEELISDTKKELKDIFRFLKIDDSFISKKYQKHNVGTIPKNKFISKIINPKIYRRFLPYIPNRLRKRIKKIAFSHDNLPEMNLNTKTFLIDFLKEDILKLSKLINKDLTSWLTI